MAAIVQESLEELNLDDDSDIEENFDDFKDSLPVITENDLISAAHMARMSIFQYLNDEPENAWQRIENLPNKSVYHSMGYAAYTGINALLTFYKEDLVNALEVCSTCASIISHHRRADSLMNNVVTKFIVRPNYNTYSEEEVHAELCYAEILTIKSLLLFIQEGNIMSYIKAGLKLRKSNQIYKECKYILDHRVWNNKELKEEFESGVDFGHGLFNIVLSTVPPRIMKILKLLGFSGDKDYALTMLNNGSRKFHTLRGACCNIALLAQKTFFSYLLSYPNDNNDTIAYYEQLLSPFLKESPKGPLTMFISARLELIKGNFLGTMSTLEDIMNGSFVIGKTKHIAAFELSWVHGGLKEWRKVAHYADILCRESLWSKTIFYYMKGCALASCEDRSDEEQDQLVECMKEVPKHVQRFIGKSLPVEKYCKRRAKRFFAENSWLPLPMLELMYTSNYFYFLKGRNDLLEPMIVEVDRTLEYLQESEHKDSRWYWDHFYLVVFLKGLCLNYMGYPLSAEEYFIEVVNNQNKIVKDVHVISFALMELGYICMETGNDEQAVEYLSAARATSIFITEFRIHSGLEELRQRGFYYDPSCNRDDFN